MTFLIMVYACMLKNVTGVATGCDFEGKVHVWLKREGCGAGESLILIR